MVVRDNSACPPCAAPFKGRDSQSACHSQDSQTALAPGNEASHILSTGYMSMVSCQLALHNIQRTLTSGGHWWGFGNDWNNGENILIRHKEPIYLISKCLLQISIQSLSWLKSTGWVNWIKRVGGEHVLHWNSQWKIKIHTFFLHCLQTTGTASILGWAQMSVRATFLSKWIKTNWLQLLPLHFCFEQSY